VLVILAAPDDLEDRFETEAAALQEAHLARAIGGAARLQAAEFPAPDVARRRELAVLEAGYRSRNRFLGNPLLAQVVLDAPRPIAFSESVHPLLHHALLGQPAAALKILEHALDLGRVFGVEGQLARELGTGVLAPREEPQRPLPQGGGLRLQWAARRASSFASALGSAFG